MSRRTRFKHRTRRAAFARHLTASLDKLFIRISADTSLFDEAMRRVSATLADWRIPRAVPASGTDGQGDGR